MKKSIYILLLFLSSVTLAQSIGIGTTLPNSSSVLDLGPSAKPLVLPRITLPAMNAVTNPANGMIVYNSDEGQLYGYMRYRTALVPLQSNSKWQPITTGPRMLAWGVVDSFATEINGSQNYFVEWDVPNHWYRVSFINPHEYYKDSMLLIVTATGNGSWDQAVSTGELIEAGGRLASIKFTDVSLIAAGYTNVDARRRSGFHFVLYDLRKAPYE